MPSTSAHRCAERRHETLCNEIAQLLIVRGARLPVLDRTPSVCQGCGVRDDPGTELCADVCAGHQSQFPVQRAAHCWRDPSRRVIRCAAPRTVSPRWFAIGMDPCTVRVGLPIEATALAPLSSVQAVLSGGPAFLAVLAERFFGFHLERRQWLGVTLTAAGLATIGLTATSEGPQRSSLGALIAAETAILALGVGHVRSSTRRDVGHRGEALLLAIAAGVLLGVSGVATKYLTHRTDRCSACSARGRSQR